MPVNSDRHLIGVFLDFENLALGFRTGGKFDIHRVLARLVEKGNIVVKRAYADWRRFGEYTNALQEAAFELLQIPARRLTGKNSADMRLSVDIMDLCYSKAHIDSFVIVSGDSDFSPLVSKLKENGKTVIGLGMKDSTSILLRDNCDEFIYYEDLKREEEAMAPAKLVASDDKEREVFTLLLDSLKALQREGREAFYASHIKDTMKRKSPSFNENYYGFKNFTSLLERAADKGLLQLSHDDQKRTHVVTSFGEEVRTQRDRVKVAPRGNSEKSADARSPRSRSPAAPRQSERAPAADSESRGDEARKPRRRSPRGGRAGTPKPERSNPPARSRDDEPFVRDEMRDDDPRREFDED